MPSDSEILQKLIELARRIGAATRLITSDDVKTVGNAMLANSSVTVNGTTNQVNVSATTVSLGGSTTLSTPQDIATTSTPQFAGITFGGTTLSTYAEGSFTPAVSFGGGSTGVTYSTQLGRYTRAGDLVFFTARVILSSKGSSTGTLAVGGLPVASANVASQNYTGAVYVSGAAYTGAAVALVPTNSTSFNLYASNGGTMTALADTNLTNTTDLIVSMVYRTN